MNQRFTYLTWVSFILGVMSPAAVHLLSKGEDDFGQLHNSQDPVRTNSWTQSSTNHDTPNINVKSHARNKRWTPVDVTHTDVINNRWWDDAKISLLKSDSSSSTGENSFNSQTGQQLKAAFQSTSSADFDGVSTTTPAVSVPLFSHLRVSGRPPTYFLQEPIGIPKHGLQYFVPEDYADHRPSSNQELNHTDPSQTAYGGRSHSEGEVRERLVLSRELNRRRVNDHQDRISGFLEPDSFFGNLNSSTTFLGLPTPASTNFDGYKSNDNTTEEATISNVERNLLEGKVFADEEEIQRIQNISNGERPSVEYLLPSVNYVVPKVDYAHRTGEFSESKVRYVQPRVVYIDPKVDYVKSGVDYVHRHIDDDYDDFVVHESPQTTTTPSSLGQFSIPSNRETEIPSEYSTQTSNPNSLQEFHFHSPLQVGTEAFGGTYYYDPISPDLQVTKYESDLEFREPEADRKHSLFRPGASVNFNDNYSSNNGNHNVTEHSYFFEGLLGADERYHHPPTASQEMNSELDTIKKDDMGVLFNNKKRRTLARLTFSDNDPQNIEPNVITTSRRSDVIDPMFDGTDPDFDNNERENIDEIENTTIWGIPKVDYPVYDDIPETSFSCDKRRGYYGDVSTRCQVFHVCQRDGRMDSFICPAGTVFNQKYLVCDWWYNVDCDSTPKYYDLLQIFFDHDSGETEDNVNSAATHNTQKPRKALPQEEGNGQFGEDLDTAGGYVGGLKPFIPPKEFPIHVVKFTPIQVGNQVDSRLVSRFKSANTIEKNPLEKRIPIRVLKTNKDTNPSSEQKREENSHSSRKFTNNLLVNKSKQAMIEQAFSMGRSNVKVPVPPRDIVVDDHNGWWRHSGVRHDLSNEKILERDQLHRPFHDMESPTTQESARRQKTPLTRKAQVVNRMAQKGLRHQSSRGKSRTTDSLSGLTTSLPPVTRRPTTTTSNIPMHTNSRFSRPYTIQQNEDIPTSTSNIYQEDKATAYSNIFHSATKEEEDIVTFPTTKLTFPSTTEVHTLRGFRRPLKMLRTTVFYPFLTTTQSPLTTTPKNVRAPKKRKYSRWGARLTGQEGRIATKINKDRKKPADLPSNINHRRHFHEQVNTREKNKNSFVSSSTPFPNPNRSGNLIKGNVHKNSSVKVRMGTKVTISMDSGGKSASPFETGGTTEDPKNFSWHEEKGSQRMKYVTPLEYISSTRVKMNDFKNHPNMLNNYTITVRRVTNDYTELPVANTTQRKRSLRTNSFSGQNKTHNIKQAIYVSAYKSNSSGKFSKTEGRKIYREDVRNSSYSNELTTENDAQDGAERVSATTIRKIIDGVTIPVTPTTLTRTTLGARNANNNNPNAIPNTRSDIIALNKKPEVHKSFGKRFEILNTIGTQKRSPAASEIVEVMAS